MVITRARRVNRTYCTALRIHSCLQMGTHVEEFITVLDTHTQAGVLHFVGVFCVL